MSVFTGPVQLRVNRAARTVMDVFQSILQKERLTKMDVSLIVDRIAVYDDRLDIRLKPDIDGLLKIGKLEDSENFPQDSKDISITRTIIQPAKNRPDKVFTVKVISDWDISCISTDAAPTYRTAHTSLSPSISQKNFLNNYFLY